MRSEVLLPLLLAACAGDTAADKSGETGAPTETGTPTTETGTPTVPGPVAALTGAVTGPSGPVADADLRLCRGALCRTGTTDAAGAFLFETIPTEWHSFHVLPPDGLATVFLALTFAEDETRTLDLQMLAPEDVSPLVATAQELPAGTGLYVTVGAADLTPPLFEDPATELAGVRVPEAAWVPVDEVPGTVLAQWFLDPFDHAAAAGLPVRIDDEWGLADGTTLKVYVGSYADSAWLDAGTVTAYGGSITGASLPVVSTVVLVQP